MKKPSSDPSIENEPHLQARFEPAPGYEKRSASDAPNTPASPVAASHVDSNIDNTVWDEPAFSSDLAGEDDGHRLTYAKWLVAKIEQTPASTTWLVTFGLILAAGPWGIFAALFEGIATGQSGLWGMVLFGPVTEEMVKIGAALWVIEKHPYWFKSWFQILLAAAAGGLAFAAIENLIYLFYYVPNSTASLALWRWTVCVALHTCCSLIAGMGLARMWSRTIRHKTKPDIALAAPFIIAAIVCHGLYNGSVAIAEINGWLDFLIEDETTIIEGTSSLFRSLF